MPDAVTVFPGTNWARDYSDSFQIAFHPVELFNDIKAAVQAKIQDYLAHDVDIEGSRVQYGDIEDATP